jgi:hypothetical protein
LPLLHQSIPLHLLALKVAALLVSDGLLDRGAL